MDEMIIVEVLDRAGRVRDRVRLDGFPASIGRAYDNALILDDEYVSPHHLLIERQSDGGLVACDQGSDNGTRLGGENAPRMRIELGVETLLRVGHTTLRLRAPTFAVAPTHISQAPIPLLGDVMGSRRWLVLFIAVTAGTYLFDAWLGTFTDTEPLKLLAGVLPMLTLIGLWAGMWALASRIFSHRASFTAHVQIACLGLVGVLLFNTLRDYYGFAFSVGDSAKILSYIGITVLFATVLTGHLHYCLARPSQRRFLNAMLIAGVLIGVGVFTEYVTKSEFSGSLDYTANLKPPIFRITRSQSLDDFFADARALKTRLDTAVSETE